VPNGVLAITVPRASVEFDVGVILTGPGIAESTQPVGIRIEGGRCRPGTVVLSPGTTLDITNADLVAHELYAVARGGTERVVAAEAISPRARRQVQLRQAGVYELRDVRQPSFRCYVIAGAGQGRVLLPTATGAFAATGLNDGDYTVKVYYQGELRATEAAVIRGHDAQVQVNLAGGSPAAPAAPAAGADDNHRRDRHER
jgi:plastocyanin